MEAVYPAAASALARGRRLRSAPSRMRHRTTPVTFAEIKEVDEDSAEAEQSLSPATPAAATASPASVGAGGERRRRPDVLEERLGRQFAEFRRRRQRRDVITEGEPAPCPPRPPHRHRSAGDLRDEPAADA